MKIDDAATRFEAYFVRQMLKEVKLGEAMVGSSGPASTFADILTETLADQVAASKPLGLERLLPAPMQMPVEGRISSTFGHRSDPITGEHAHHAGIDIAAPAGTPVRAAADGVIQSAEERGGYGRVITIEHADGTTSRYAHLERMDVGPGQQIARGEPIGRVGSSGRSTGPHLHFEVRKGGQPVDPRKLLSPLKVR